MEEYNKALEHFYKAANTMDDLTVAIEKKDKWQGRFRELLDGLNKLVGEIEKELDREMTESEIINGFSKV
jgi:hypothetical protein